MPGRKPPAALTTQRGARPSAARRSQSASTSSGEVRSTASRAARAARGRRPDGGRRRPPGRRARAAPRRARGRARRRRRRRARRRAIVRSRARRWLRTSSRNSRRSSGSSNAPRQNVVIVRECSSTPRICVQRCDASRWTATPRGAISDDEPVGDLLAEALLHREPAREEAHEARQLRDADDPLACDVADVRGAEERQRVVLAEALERDRALDDLADRATPAGRALSAGKAVSSFGSPS